MRLVLGFALIWRAVGRSSSDPSPLVTVLSVLGIGAGLLLLMGLWTPVAATLVAAIELWKIYWKLGDPWIYLLLATIAAAIAMVGPGLLVRRRSPVRMEAHRTARSKNPGLILPSGRFPPFRRV